LNQRPLPPESSDLPEKPLKLRRRLHAKGPEWTGDDRRGHQFSTFSAHPHRWASLLCARAISAHRFLAVPGFNASEECGRNP